MPLETRLVVVLFAAACHAGARHAEPGLIAAGDRSAASRAVLLDAGNPHWTRRAPDRVRARFETTQGAFVIELDRALAPLGVDHFYALASAGFFDDARFHRVVPNFIMQFGIPGDPAVTAVWKDRVIRDDSVRTSNVRGTIAYAMTGPNTRTTQLFVSLVDNSRLDAQGFAPLGRVVEGMEVVDRIYSGYGEASGGGVRAGKQQHLLEEGNAYLDREFPKLDRLLRVTVYR